MALRDERIQIVLTQMVKGEVSMEPHDSFVPPMPIADIPPPVSLRGMSLQVITKAAKIYLTPKGEDPNNKMSHKYKGGSWHVEGMRNENIVATVIYYAETENITQSSLAFRKPISSEWVRESFSSSREIVQLVKCAFDTEIEVEAKIGAVPTNEGRLLVFPNTMQHCVSPFQLKDESKPGWRTVVVFFLVHPRANILSTSMIPSQDVTWQERAWIRILRQVFKNNHDVAWEVSGYLLCGPTKEQAQKLRLELMAERGKGSHGSTRHQGSEYAAKVDPYEFDLCEH